MGADPTGRSCQRCAARLASDNPGPLCRPCEHGTSLDGLNPPAVPPEFWDNQQLRHALTTERHIGHAVRSYRKHPFHGRRPIPQEVAARWLNISQAQLARIERGRPPTDLDRLIEWAGTLRIPQELLWFSLPVEAPDERDDVKRRQFLTAAIALPQLSRIAIVSPASSRMPDSLPDSDLRDIVRDMTALRAVLARQDNVLGASAVAPTVSHQISILRSLSASARGEGRELLMRLQAAYAEFDSWLSDELGNRGEGLFWIDRALEWSHETGDDLLIGYILARKAQRAIDENEPCAAVSLARAAQRCGLTDRMRAAALQYEAIGHASMAEATDFRQAIDRAHELTNSLAPAKENDWAVWCTPGYVTMHEANGWLRLGEPTRAVAAYEQGLANWPHEFLRDQGVYYSGLARAQVLARNPDGAEHAGRTALDIARRTGSARILAELASLPRALAEWQDSELVRKFVSDLANALPSHRESH